MNKKAKFIVIICCLVALVFGLIIGIKLNKSDKKTTIITSTPSNAISAIYNSENIATSSVAKEISSEKVTPSPSIIVIDTQENITSTPTPTKEVTVTKSPEKNDVTPTSTPTTNATPTKEATVTNLITPVVANTPIPTATNTPVPTKASNDVPTKVPSKAPVTVECSHNSVTYVFKKNTITDSSTIPAWDEEVSYGPGLARCDECGAWEDEFASYDDFIYHCGIECSSAWHFPFYRTKTVHHDAETTTTYSYTYSYVNTKCNNCSKTFKDIEFPIYNESDFLEMKSYWESSGLKISIQ